MQYMSDPDHTSAPEPYFAQLLAEQDPNSYVREMYGLGWRDAVLPAALAGPPALEASAVIDPATGLREQLKLAAAARSSLPAQIMLGGAPGAEMGALLGQLAQAEGGS